MDAFPAFFPLAGKTVVIAGRGEGAEAKARLFEGSPARIIRLEGPDALVPEAYDGATLVFVADADEVFAQAAVAAARRVGALVNATDRPDLCDFTTPAVIDRGAVVAAIGTGGASPMLAAMLRNDVERQVPEGAGRVAALLASFQGQVRERFAELHLRRAFLRDALNGPAVQAALAGDMDLAHDLFRQALAIGHSSSGKVWITPGAGPADLLSVRASRTLASADILAADLGVDPGVLAMARRDAERLTPDQADIATLAELARAGRQVVRLVVGASDHEAAALRATGATVEVLSAAPGE